MIVSVITVDYKSVHTYMPSERHSFTCQNQDIVTPMYTEQMKTKCNLTIRHFLYVPARTWTWFYQILDDATIIDGARDASASILAESLNHINTENGAAKWDHRNTVMQ